MGRIRVVALAALVAVGTAGPAYRMNTHGLWFDEAYTARLARLAWPRMLEGAALEIHPPGWTLICAAFLGLPVPPEIAMRLPSLLAITLLSIVVGHRNLMAGVAVMSFAPILDQAIQARPYALVTLGLVAGAQLCASRKWFGAGVVFGVTSSLHVLAGPLAGAIWLASAIFCKVNRVGALSALLPWAALCIGWLPDVARAAQGYLGTPWYGGATLADIQFVTSDGAVVVAFTCVAISAAIQKNWRPLLPAGAVAGTLVGLELIGIGTEIRKTGVVLLPLLVAGMDRSWNSTVAATVSALALLTMRTPMLVRPDLREAAVAIRQLDTDIPVLVVFASEASWYIRQPGALPGGRDPVDIAARIGNILHVEPGPCVINIALPDTFPAEAGLPAGVRTVGVAEVTGLDVRLVGTEECVIEGQPAAWSPAR